MPYFFIVRNDMRIPEAIIETDREIREAIVHEDMDDASKRRLVRCRASIGWLIDHLMALDIVRAANCDEVGV